MRVLDVGLCSDKCKLYEVVCPFGKCGDRVYRGCEKDEGMGMGESYENES